VFLFDIINFQNPACPLGMPALALRIEETFIFANAIVVDPFIVFVTVFAIQTLTARTIASTAAPSIPAAAPAAIAFPDLRVLSVVVA
jgi:hypothetical protein